MDTVTKTTRRLSYGIIIVIAAVVIQLIGWGTFGTFGIFVNQFELDLGWTRASVSGVASVILLVHGLFSILVGSISDRYGPRIVMTACAIILTLGVFLSSRVTQLWQLYLSWGLIVGIGSSALDVVVLSTIARWFSRSRGSINGLVKSGAGIGHLTMPLLAGALIVTQGWRNTYVFLAVICFVILVIAAQFLKRNPAVPSSPQPGKNTPAGSVQTIAGAGLSFRQSVRLPQFWAVLGIYFAGLFCTYTIQIHIAPHAISLGSSVPQAAGILSIVGASSVIGRFGMGNLGDRFGNIRAMMICFALLVITLFGMGFIKQTWMLYLFLPVYGFGHGGILSLISPMIAGLFGTGSHGSIYGLIIFGGTIGGAIGPLLAGSIFDNTASYSIVFFMLSVMAVLGLILLATLKPVKSIVKE